jgi:hypothetical protein
MMKDVNEKEKKIRAALREKKISPRFLALTMKTSIWICVVLWVFLPLGSLLAFMNEGPPKVYHMLALAAIIFCSAGIYIHCKTVLLILKKIISEQGRSDTKP